MSDEEITRRLQQAAIFFHRRGNNRVNVPLQDCERIDATLNAFFDDLRTRKFNDPWNPEANECKEAAGVPRDRI